MSKRISFLLILFIICHSLAATARQSNYSASDEKAIDKGLQQAFDKLIKKQSTGSLSDLDASVDEMWQKIKAMQQKRKDSVNKELEAKVKLYEPKRKPQPGDKDLFPLLQEIPAPIPDLPAAKKASPRELDRNVYSKNSVYTAYIEKVKLQQQMTADEARDFASIIKKSPEQVEQEARNMAAKAQQDLNNNTIIQQMGGMEKLKNMSPEERKIAAQQMAAKVKQSPASYTAQSGQQVGFAEGLAQNNKTRAVMDIQKRIQALHDRMKEMYDIVASQDKQTEMYFASLGKKLDAAYKQQIDALPMVELGEAGHGKITRPVDMAYQTLVYRIAVEYAAAKQQVWIQYKNGLKYAIGEFNDFIGDYWGSKKAPEMMLTDMTLQIAGAINGVYGEMILLAEQARKLTDRNGGHQRSYDEMVLNKYE